MAPPPRDRRGAPQGGGGRKGGGRPSGSGRPAAPGGRSGGGAKKAGGSQGGFSRGRRDDSAAGRPARRDLAPRGRERDDRERRDDDRRRDDRPRRDERGEDRARGANRGRPERTGNRTGSGGERRGGPGDRNQRGRGEARGDSRGRDRDDRRDGRGENFDPRPQPSAKAPKKWGSLARKGTRWLADDESTASGVWRKTMEDARETERLARPVEREEPEVWIREDEEEEAPAASPPATRARRPKVPEDVAAEISGKVDAKQRERDLQRLSDAIRAYDRDRYQDALRMLKVIIEHAPDVAAARELHGLTLYRLGRWPAAVKELRAYFELSGSYDQHPTLMDAYRAQKRWPTVERLWNEMKEASPHPAVVAEGRIVMAGAFADRGDLRKAIDLLERSKPVVKNPKDHHLRTMYALADLYDRAGDIPRARDLFRRLADIDPDYFDVRSRLRSL